MRLRDPELNSKWGTICTPVAMIAKDGKARKTNASNIQGIFRIIQSIPSPKAEPFTESINPQAYWRKLKQRLKEEGNKTVTNCHTLKIRTHFIQENFIKLTF